jgi:hypothetical protein
MVALFIIQGNRKYLTIQKKAHSCDILRSNFQCCASKCVGQETYPTLGRGQRLNVEGNKPMKTYGKHADVSARVCVKRISLSWKLPKLHRMHFLLPNVNHLLLSNKSKIL